MSPIPKLPLLSKETFGRNDGPAPPGLLDAPGRVYTTSGRSAILLALEAFGVGAGDRVLVPTYHCPSMIAPVVAVGATPVFYPIDRQGHPSRDWLARHAPTSVAAMLVSHYFGVATPMAWYRAWCDERSIRLIEDCAHAFFGTSDGRTIGHWGHAATGSLTKFFPVSEGGGLWLQAPVTKPLALTGAGWVNQLKAVVQVLESAVHHGRQAGLASAIVAALGALRRLTRRRPAVTLAMSTGSPPAGQLRIDMAWAHRAPAWFSRRIVERADRDRIVRVRRLHDVAYRRSFAAVPGLRPLAGPLADHAAPYVFPLWADDPDPVYRELRRLAMPVYRWDELWPGTPAIEGDQGRLWARHVLQLGCHQDLRPAEREMIVDAVLCSAGHRGDAHALHATGIIA